MGFDDIPSARKLDEERQKYENSCAEQAQTTNACGVRAVSLAEQHTHQAQFHSGQAVKSRMAAAFFREHPEFEEFISLLRSGVVQL